MRKERSFYMLIKFLICLALVVSGSSERHTNYAENRHIGLITPARSAGCDPKFATYCPSYIKKMGDLEYEERQILKRKQEHVAEQPPHLLLETPGEHQRRLYIYHELIKQDEEDLEKLKQARKFLQDQAEQGMVSVECAPCYR